MATQGSASLFGGLAPEVLAGLVTGGFATWLDTDAADRDVVTSQAATVVEAPIEEVFATVTDFAHYDHFLTMSGPGRVRPLGDDRIEVTLEQRVGLAILSVGIDLSFRLRLHPPRAVRCEEYLGGTLADAVFEADLLPLSANRTLLMLTLLADIRSLGWLVRFFLRRVPELELPIAGNIVVVPLTALAAEAQRRVGTAHRRAGPPPQALWEAMEAGTLGPALAHGALTVGRMGPDRQILDVASATRIAGTPEEVWPLVVEPERRRGLVSVVDHGRTISRAGGRLDMEYGYTIRLGPLRKRYTIRAAGPMEAPHRFVADQASVDGRPARYADHLVPFGEHTLLCHTYYGDLKQDWLSGRFLAAHTEFERLISTYPPLVFVRALRRHFGSP